MHVIPPPFPTLVSCWVTVAGGLTGAGRERGGIRAGVLDQVRARVVGRRVDRLAEADHHVLLLEPVRSEPLEMAVEPARRTRQAGVVRVIDQIRRHQGEREAVDVALILLFGAEQGGVRWEERRGGKRGARRWRRGGGREEEKKKK